MVPMHTIFRPNPVTRFFFFQWQLREASSQQFELQGIWITDHAHKLKRPHCTWLWSFVPRIDQRDLTHMHFFEQLSLSTWCWKPACMCEDSFQHVRKFGEPEKRRERSTSKIRTLCNLVTITWEDLKILYAASKIFPCKITFCDVQLLVRCAKAGISFFIHICTTHTCNTEAATYMEQTK